MGFEKSLAVSLLLLMVMSGFVGPANGAVDEGTANMNELQPSVAAYTAHAPIRIDNDTDFAAQAATEGWKGSGTAEDPYIIENYEINGTGYGYCIYIGNTTDYFVVRNCSLHNASGNLYWTYSMQSGLYFYNVDNGMADKNRAFNNRHGIYLLASNNNILSNNTVSINTEYGICLSSSVSNVLSNNTMEEDGIGISGGLLSYWNTHVIENNTVNGKPVYYWKNMNGGAVPPGGGEIILANCTGVVVEGQNISNGSIGIELGFSNNNTLINNTAFSNHYHGIYLYSSWNNTLANNTASSSTYHGIILDTSCNNNTLANNTASSNNYDGIYIKSSSGNILVNNTASSNTYHSIFLYLSDSNTLVNNTALNARYGIKLLYSEDNTLVNNTASSNTYHGIILDTSSNNKLANNTASSNNNDGIFIKSSRGNILFNNTALNNYYGIYLESSNGNTLSNNTASSNSLPGIYLYLSDSNTLANNSVSNNDYGIPIYYSNSNVLFNNTALNNDYGIYLYSSNSNTIYHNNFIDNTNQAYDDTGNNFWNVSYPVGGNYWSDYTGLDQYSGPGQNESGSDGIGDTPYTAIGGGGASDSYPIVYPTWHTPNHLADTPWPMFRHDLFHSGISPYNSSAGPWLYWNFTTGGEVRASPAIASDGTIYAGSYDGKLYALSPNGTELWSFTADGSIGTSSPAIAKDGTVYFGTVGGTLYALNPNGTEKWEISIGAQIWSSPSIGSDGTIYVGANDNRLHAISPEGASKWNFTANSAVTTSPVIDPDGKIIFSSYNNYTYALNPNGSLNWSLDLHSNISASPLILQGGANYIVVIACTDGNVSGFYANNGTSAGNVSVGAPISSSPIFNDPYLYIADENGAIHAFNVSSDMTEDWNFTAGDAIYSSPVIDAQGNLYFGSADGKIYALSSTGSQLWNHTVGSGINGSPVINDGILYIGAGDGNIYAIGDPLPPSISISSPLNNSLLNTGTVTVYWNGTDSGSGIGHYQYRITPPGAPVSWASAGLATNHTFTNLSDGHYTVYIAAVDNAENMAIGSVSFDVDTTPPEIVNGTPEPDAIGVPLNQPIVINFSESINTSTFAYSCSPDPAGWTTAWSNNNTTVSLNHNDFEYNTTYTFNVTEAKDLAGNSLKDAPASVNFTTVDESTPPSVTITSPADASILDRNNVSVEWTGSDAASGIDHYEVRIDGGSWTDVGVATSHDFTGLSDGSHTVNVKAVDKAENENTTSVTFTIDTTSPSISIISPSGGAITNSTSMTVTWGGSDVTSGIDHYEMRIDDGSWAGVGTATSYDFTELSDGSHTVDVKAVDNAGNEATASVSFSIDATAPTISVHSPTGQNVSLTSTITVTFSEPMNISSVQIIVDSLTGTISWNGNTAVFTPNQNLTAGTLYVVNVTGTDIAGNRLVSYSWNFTTENRTETLPVAAHTGSISGIVTDENGNPISGATVTVQGTDISATTDAEGRFLLENVTVGPNNLTISRDGFTDSTTPVTVTEGKTTTVNPMLHPIGSQPSTTEFPWWGIVLALVAVLAIGTILMKKRNIPSSEEPPAIEEEKSQPDRVPEEEGESEESEG